MIEGKAVYQISFKPIRKQDFAFSGTIWIDRESFALVQIKATVEPSANLNFIHKISIQQQMDVSAPSPWLPVKLRILLEIDQISKNSTGLLAKFYSVNSKPVVNTIYPPEYFNERISVSAEAQNNDEQFWVTKRPDSLTSAELAVYHLIDTVKSIPSVKTYIEIADLLINGYYRMDKINLGPILQSYSYNNLEGSRFTLGFKTNSRFSNKWIFRGNIAYGTLDREWKYGIGIDYIFSRKNWSETGISYSRDINLVALLSDNNFYQKNNLFSTFTRFGSITSRKAFDQKLFSVYYRRNLFRGFTEKISFAT